jgi:hypothetical protein
MTICGYPYVELGRPFPQPKFPDVLAATAPTDVLFGVERLFFVAHGGKTYAVMAQSSQDAWHQATNLLVIPEAA